jgi:hypothetical protein
VTEIGTWSTAHPAKAPGLPWGSAGSRSSGSARTGGCGQGRPGDMTLVLQLIGWSWAR